MKKIKYIIALLSMLIFVYQLDAQIHLDDNIKNRVYLKVGIEPTTMVTFGYQHSFSSEFLNRTINAFAEWKVPVYKFNLKNSELKIGGIIPLLEKGNFKIINNLNFSFGGVSTRHFSSKRLAIADELSIGMYKNNWFVAATFEYEKILLINLQHTDFYKESYYPDAKDGWYKGTGGMFQVGIQGGLTIKEKYDVKLEAKMPFTEKFNNYGGSPLHANLAFGYRF